MDPDAVMVIDQKNALAGRVRAHEQGRHASGPAPYGYRIQFLQTSKDERVGKTLQPMQPEAGVVYAIYAMAAADATTKRIAATLTRCSVLTPTKKAARWSPSTITAVLSNPVYIGYVGFDGHFVRGIHKPLVSPELWRAAAAMVATRRTKPTSRTRTPL